MFSVVCGSGVVRSVFVVCTVQVVAVNWIFRPELNLWV